MSEATALLLVSFGGPEGPDDVMPFLRNATRGRNVPEERLAAVAEHYHHFGGVSPINEQNRALLAALRPALASAGVDLPLYWGNRNWHPLLPDTIAQMAADGHRHVVALATSAWSSYSGCRQYREDLARAVSEAGVEMTVCKIRPFSRHAGFLDAQADRVRAALDGSDWTSPHLAFVAHSIPTAMAASSAYEAEVVAAAAAVAGRLDEAVEHSVAWCSRSGPPSVPWLEPDINDHLAALEAAGSEEVVIVPIGFVSDHMEVIWDLDEEAATTSERLGLTMVRAGTVGTHPAFVAGLVELLLAAANDGTTAMPVAAGTCDADCCLAAGRPVQPVVAPC